MAIFADTTSSLIIVFISPEKLSLKLKEILNENKDPFKIAFGFGVGVFIGFLPFYGFQTILSIIAAYLIPKVNKASLILATQLFLPPVIPFVISINYIAGSLLLHGRISFAAISDVSDAMLYFIPVLVGSIPCGIIAGVLSYFLIYGILKKTKKKRPILLKSEGEHPLY